MPKKITKAVIPAAGLGTRFLPATKAQPKEMLPVVDKPVIQYVVEEAVASGCDDILIITGRGKQAIENHFDKSFELEHSLAEKKRREQLAIIEELNGLADIHYVRQREPKGLGDAIRYARKHVGDEPFAILLGDTIIQSKIPCTKQLIETFERYQSNVIAVETISPEDTRRYGVVAGKELQPGLILVGTLVEKPGPEHAPSNLGIIGRYVLTPQIFDSLEKTRPGVGGEIQLTDALQVLCQNQALYALRFDGTRYDIGTVMDWLKTQIALGLQHPKYGAELREYLKKFM
ncbi:MAG: UTP--glucose-1-phosphate uridylyltransferase [Methanobacteriota archaeon]|nr:MAG: UTP--glucose-1-phosphate uridylyltransferase [Euryarchaeota archaeon]